MALKNQAILIISLTIITLVFYFRLTSYNPIAKAGPEEERIDMDIIQSIAKNMLSQHYDKDGRVNYSFYAKEVVHLSHSDNQSTQHNGSYTRLSEPVIAFYQPTENWQVTAATGRVDEANQDIFLSGNVELQRIADGQRLASDASQSENAGERNARMTTETLLIKPQSKLAQTDSPVTITDGSSSLSAVGMTLDIEQQKLKLHAQVRGIHAPIQ